MFVSPTETSIKFQELYGANNISFWIKNYLASLKSVDINLMMYPTDAVFGDPTELQDQMRVVKLYCT